MALVDDPQLEVLYAELQTFLLDASLADQALEGAIASVPQLRTDAQEKANLAREKYVEFLDRLLNGPASDDGGSNAMRILGEAIENELTLDGVTAKIKNKIKAEELEIA